MKRDTRELRACRSRLWSIREGDLVRKIEAAGSFRFTNVPSAIFAYAIDTHSGHQIGSLAKAVHFLRYASAVP
jgi:hypothetical protein